MQEMQRRGFNPGVGNGNALQYSRLEKFHRGGWWAVVLTHD